MGQTIEVLKGKKEKEAGGPTFKLIEVQPRREVLETEGQRFELLIPEAEQLRQGRFFGGGEQWAVDSG